ncbi:MAG TPA: hypothetical protein VKU80_06400, partial [Planctomycetota bacterium]|nr:hypothetical protein [Planctomycetota bacterium]
GVPPGQGSNEVVQYDLNGNVQKTFTVGGHTDGIMAFDSNTIWVMSNEDSGPYLTVIDVRPGGLQKVYQPKAGTLTHGGGLDDMVMIAGVVYVTASNPALTPVGVPPVQTNQNTAVYTCALDADGIHFDLAPVVAGNASSTDIPSGSPVSLNLTDPDSEEVDPSGRLVVDSQADSLLLFIKNPQFPVADQTRTSLPLTLFGNPWQVDDTRFAPSSRSYLLVCDTGANVIYRVDATAGFVPGAAYSASGGGVYSLDLGTGFLSPLVVGMKTPHGMRFVPPTPLPVPSPVQVLQNSLAVSVFAHGPDGCSKPDSIVQMGTSVYVAYQNGLNPDGTNPGGVPAGQGADQIVQYDLEGNLQKIIQIQGHNDGLLAFNATTLWAMSNEDSGPILTIIDTTGVAPTKVLTPKVALTHGGGLDDMVLIGGVVYASASNPTNLTAAGVNNQPAIVKITLDVDGTHFDTATVLLGNATTNDAVPVTLNLLDPDSEAIDPSGNLVLDSQSDSLLVTIHNPGVAQTVTSLSLTLFGNPWPVDDTRFVPPAGPLGKTFMLVVDTGANLIYRVDAPGGWTTGAAFSNSGGGVYALDYTTGILTPAIGGMTSPHGMLFIAQ